MGSTAAETQGEITRLRGDMTAAVDEIERRLTGGLKTVAGTEARITSVRTRQEVAHQMRQKAPLLGVAGVIMMGAIGYGLYLVITSVRERQKRRHRLKQGVKDAGVRLAKRVGDGIQRSRRQLERVGQRSLVVNLDPEDGGYVRVTRARLEPAGR